MSEREDFVGNNNPAVFAYATDAGLFPDWALNSPMPTEDSLSELSDKGFANPLTRNYPCHTKAACLMSAVWNASHPSVGAVESNIKDAAAALGCKDEVDKIYGHFKEAFAKSAAVQEHPIEEKYALSVSLGDESEKTANFYPVTTYQDTVDSADKLAKDYNNGVFGSDVMRKAATAIIKAASDLDVDQTMLPQSVRSFGVVRLPDPYAAEPFVVGFCKAANVDASPYLNLLHNFQNQFAGFQTVEDAIAGAEKVASAFSDMNLANHILQPKFGLENPYGMLFQGPTVDEFYKVAGSRVYVLGVAIPAAEIRDLSDYDIDTQFAKAAAANIREARDVLNTGITQDTVNTATDKLGELSKSAARNLLRILSE